MTLEVTPKEQVQATDRLVCLIPLPLSQNAAACYVKCPGVLVLQQQTLAASFPNCNTDAHFGTEKTFPTTRSLPKVSLLWAPINP